jgi:tRNA modification GTPase
VVAASIRAALDALVELGGGVTPDEVLGRIFSHFCIGK